MQCYYIKLLIIAIFFTVNTTILPLPVQDTTDTTENLLTYLKHELKNPAYQTETLPHDLSSITRFISLGSTYNQQPTYLRSVIKLFSNIVKGCPYIDAQECEQFLKALPGLTAPYFSFNASNVYYSNLNMDNLDIFDRFNATVNNILYIKFSNEYRSFKQDPHAFLQVINADILTMIEEELNKEYLRYDLIRFIEIILNKLLWNIDKPENSWSTTKNIALHLAELFEHNIFEDTSNLNDFYWSLVTRYSYFLDIAKIDLLPSFYKTVKENIAQENILFLELAEQDSCVESKWSYFQRTIISCEAQSRHYYIKQEQ